MFFLFLVTVFLRMVGRVGGISHFSISEFPPVLTFIAHFIHNPAVLDQSLFLI